jgi:serine/threonine protein phosphatase 1
MPKTFVIGDIHGGHKALRQCLESCKFDYKIDVLITLGDYVDGWPESYEVIEELLKIKNRICIKGNHDDYFLKWLSSGNHPVNWTQGAYWTAVSYLQKCHRDIKVETIAGKHNFFMSKDDIPDTHQDFFNNLKLFHVDHLNRCFVHGGFNRHFTIEQLLKFNPEILYWDRDLWAAALSWELMEKEVKITYPFKIKDNFLKIYIGHSPTLNWKKDTPMKAANIINVDTGAGFFGKLTIMDIDTEEYWQSDNVNLLYPDFEGR